MSRTAVTNALTCDFYPASKVSEADGAAVPKLLRSVFQGIEAPSKVTIKMSPWAVG